METSEPQNKFKIPDSILPEKSNNDTVVIEQSQHSQTYDPKQDNIRQLCFQHLKQITSDIYCIVDSTSLEELEKQLKKMTVETKEKVPHQRE